MSEPSQDQPGSADGAAPPESGDAVVPAAPPVSPDGTRGSLETGVPNPVHPAASTGGNPLFTLRGEVSRWVNVAAGVSCLGICALLWWWTTDGAGEERLLGHNQLPSIQETIDRLPEVLDDDSRERHLLDNTLVSLKRVVIGFALALAVGIPIGVAAGCFPFIRSFFAPITLFGRNIPIAALIPLVMALFGTGETQKYMFIFIACAAFIISDTIDAVNEVAHRYVETALTLGATQMQIVFKVLVPLAMPMVFNAVRVMFGLAFGYIMLVESISEGDGAGGLGFLLNIARKRSITEYTMIIILTIPLVAWMIDQTLYVVQLHAFRWKYADEAERSGTFRLSRWLIGFFWRGHARKPAVEAAES